MKKERINRFEPVFTDYVPEKLEEGKLYLSLKYKTAIHLCACGCGHRVVTPLNRNGWKITFEATLTPSIGNFEYPCHSHYWIRHNKVVWCDDKGLYKKARKKWLSKLIKYCLSLVAKIRV